MNNNTKTKNTNISKEFLEELAHDLKVIFGQSVSSLKDFYTLNSVSKTQIAMHHTINHVLTYPISKNPVIDVINFERLISGLREEFDEQTKGGDFHYHIGSALKANIQCAVAFHERLELAQQQIN